MSVHEHAANGRCRRRPDLVEMNEPVTNEVKETHDDGLAFYSFDPITFLEISDKRRVDPKRFGLFTTFAFKSGENAEKTSDKCGPRSPPSL